MSHETAPRPWRASEVDAQRLARALALTVTDVLDTGLYAVHSPSSNETHYVNLRDLDCPACDCGDHIFRERLCAHALAALLYEKDARLCSFLGQLVRRAWLEQRLVFAIMAAPLGQAAAVPAVAELGALASHDASPDGGGQ